MKRKIIRQKIHFKASAQSIYDALMDSKSHASFTGAPTKISKKVGGKFSVFDGYAVGKNLELIPGKKIVQSWRASDWSEGHESQVMFEITPSKTGCTLTFTHSNVPSEHFSSIKKGWIDFYWLPMKEMVNNVEK